MDVLKVIVQIIYILICIVLTVIVLKQEGKSEGGLSGALTGVSDSYWSKNKARSKEGFLDNTTKILGVLFVALSVVLNLF